MKFQKYMAVGIIGLTMALGLADVRVRTRRIRMPIVRLELTVWQRAIMIRRSNPFRKP